MIVIIINIDKNNFYKRQSIFSSLFLNCNARNMLSECVVLIKYLIRLSKL